MIRIDAVWLATLPLDMCAGADTAVARAITVFGVAHLKVLVHDGIGVRLAARRLHQGKFIWASRCGANRSLGPAQLDALVLRLPWQRMGDEGIITVV
ncbi:IS66 family insertion sequence element accessory protein TnpB [Rhodoferax sp.]|uniref:IS66 family insertion sequence element accessory protein TnpB n=1 Tax=Rhodoferax sp. TaxID=50421 RepID=UPI00374CBE61